MSMKDGPFKRAYLQIGGATGWAPFEKVWELLKHTLYNIQQNNYSETSSIGQNLIELVKLK